MKGKSEGQIRDEVCDAVPSRQSSVYFVATLKPIANGGFSRRGRLQRNTEMASGVVHSFSHFEQLSDHGR